MLGSPTKSPWGNPETELIEIFQTLPRDVRLLVPIGYSKNIPQKVLDKTHLLFIFWVGDVLSFLVAAWP